MQGTIPTVARRDWGNHEIPRCPYWDVNQVSLNKAVCTELSVFDS